MTDQSANPQRVAVERLTELLAKATPGPWQAKDPYLWDEIVGNVDGPDDGQYHYTEVAQGYGKADAALIVEAVNALPALLQQVTEQAAEIERLQSTLVRRTDALHAWKSRAEAAERAREECVALVRRIVSDRAWRTNDNTLWPDLVAFLAANGAPMSKRNDVLALLHVAGQSGASCNITPDLLAELCRAWLALDSAPEALLDFDAIPGGNVVCTYDIDIHHELVGQCVRLVATPTTRGPSDG